MALQAMWLHGNAVVVQFPGGDGHSPSTSGHRMKNLPDNPWTDIVGLHQPNGATFRGYGGNTNSFHVSIPTPCWRDGVQAKLAMVGFLFTSDTAVPITGVRLFDGPNPLPFSIPSMNLSGVHTTLVGNVNRFDLQTPIDIIYGLGVTIDVSFNQEGQITFHTVGADFNV